MITNEQDSKKIQDAIKEISDSMLRSSSEKELVKELAKRIKEELDVEPKLLKKLAKLYFDNSKEKFVQETEETIETYESIFGKQ